MPIIAALKRGREEHQTFKLIIGSNSGLEASLDYMTSFQNKQTNKSAFPWEANSTKVNLAQPFIYL